MGRRLGDIGVYVDVLAHSGANIEAAGGGPSYPGEIPDTFPTILQQVANFTGAPDSVDLILLDGGINDVNVRYVLDPTVPTSHVAAIARAHCGDGMRRLLEAVLDRFGRANPDLVVIVTGYFQILSEASDDDRAAAFLAAAGVTLLAAWAAVKAEVIEHCVTFAQVANDALGQVVTAVNSSLGTPHIYLAVPQIGPEHAALAADAWLFGVNAQGSPEDPVASQRRRQCDDASQGFECRMASVGHPNQRGEAAYYHAVLPYLDHVSM
jgi:hypothetical protein